MDLKLVTPKDTTYGVYGNDPSGGFNNRRPKQFYNNVFRGDNFVTAWAVKDGTPTGAHSHIVITQKIENLDGVKVKKTEIKPYVGRDFPTHKSFETLSKDGYYTVARQIGDDIVGGYEMNLKPVDRTFAQGIKGRLQKAAMAISTDVNGCERPVLRRIGALLLNIAKKIR